MLARLGHHRDPLKSLQQERQAVSSPSFRGTKCLALEEVGNTGFATEETFA